MGRKKFLTGCGIATLILAFTFLGIRFGPSVVGAEGEGVWFWGKTPKQIYQLYIYKLNAPLMPTGYPLTIGAHTLAGTVTATGQTINGGTFNSSTIASPTITGTAAFANAPVVKNLVNNAKLSIWTSGSTRDGVSGLSAPDGWYIGDQANTGLTRYGQSDSQLISTGATVYGGLGYAMYVEAVGTIHGQTDEISYFSGVSNQAWWYQRFRGKQVQWGAMVYTDPATTGATDFIRPYIITCTNARTSNGVSLFATYSSDYSNGGWAFMSATTTVPVGATALEVGFEVKNSTGLSGESAFILGPVFLSGSTVSATPIVDQETIFFTKTIDVFGSGGSTFGVGSSGSLDISANNGWGGKIPDDASSIYATVIVGQGYPNVLHLYGDDAVGGVSFYGVVSGTSPQSTTAWIPVSASGTINVSNPTAAVSGTSLFAHGAIIR